MRAIITGMSLGLSASLCLWGAPVAAQAIESDCRGAESTALDSRGNAVARANAVDQLKHCLAVAGRVGARLWEENGRPAELQRALASMSMELRDRQLLEALLRVAQDRGRLQSDRVLALRATVRYVDPSFAVSESTLLNPSAGPVDLRPTHVGPDRVGAEPPDAGTRARVLQAIAQISMGTGDETMGRAARFLRQSLAYAYPSETPLSPGSITVAWDCRGHLRLSSTADIALPLTLEMPSIHRTQSIEMAASNGTGPAIQTRQLNYEGPIVLKLGTRQVAVGACVVADSTRSGAQ